MKNPSFFCIGAQKSGTTLLYELLRGIEEIYLPEIKEVHFFDTPSRYKNGLEWYRESYFKNSQNYLQVGEITPSYLFLSDVAKKIHDDLGSALKFIVILRNPIDRAYSHYIMRYKRGEEKHSFNDALMLESSRVRKSLEYKKKYSYLERGLYTQQIQEYLKYFKKEQFMFILFEDFTKKQDLWIENICRFLNVDKIKKCDNILIHKAKLSISEKFKFCLLNDNYNIMNILKAEGYPKMNPKTRTLLKEYYFDEIKSLEKAVDKDLFQWLQ